MSRKLETATNIVVMGVALLFGFLLLRNYSMNRNQANTDPGPPVGLRLASLPGYDWHSHDRSLVLALRKGCHYCEDSMPFYRKLVGLAHSKQISANLLAVFPDDALVADEEMKSDGLSMDVSSGVVLGELDVSGTPTVILVDNQGRVLRDWVGELSTSQQDQVLEAMKNAR
jgi:hypothetical protein